MTTQAHLFGEALARLADDAEIIAEREAERRLVAPVRRIEFRYLDLPEVLPRARRMSFFLTTAQVLARTKTVTRRDILAWAGLKAGDNLIAIEKGQGHKVLALLEVVDVRVEPLDAITAEDCAREGFPAMTPVEFCEFFRRQA